MVTLAATQKTIVSREAWKWGYTSWKAITVIQVSDGWWLGLGWWRSEKWSDFGYLQGNAGRTSFLILQGMMEGTWWVDAAQEKLASCFRDSVWSTGQHLHCVGAC